MLITLLIVTNYWMKVLFTMNCKEIKIITVQISLSITIRAQWMVKYRDCDSHFPIASSNLRPLCLYSLNQILEIVFLPNCWFLPVWLIYFLWLIMIPFKIKSFSADLKNMFIFEPHFKVFGSLIRACYTVNRTRTVLGFDITSPTLLQGAERDM